MPSDQQFIRLRGVRQNNLKNLNLDLPLGKLIAVTGLSGSGKSSLVFDTLHAEGQRRYVETFSPYTRQFLELLDRPKADSIENIPPSIAIEQSNTVRNSRSTVGTMTELTDFFKVWFAHVAELFDPVTGEKIEDDNPQTVWQKTSQAHPGEDVLLAFSVTKPENLTWPEILTSLQKQGYTRGLLLQGNVERLEAIPEKVLKKTSSLFIIQDRLSVKEEQRARFLEAAETALHYGHGEIFVFNRAGERIGHFCQGLQSPATKQKFRPATPALFSFNSPLGACARCRGFGRVIEIDYNLAIPDRSLSIKAGAVRAWQGNGTYAESQADLLKHGRKKGIPLDVPFNELSREEQDFVILGEPGYGENGVDWPRAWYGVKGFFDWLETKTYKMHVRIFLAKYRAYRPCPDCGGTRLQPESLCWKWNGRTLPDLYALPVAPLLELLTDAKDPKTKKSLRNSKPASPRPAALAFDSILSRLHYLDQVGLGYLTLDRASRTLSGGEVERVNLTACLGTSLVDTLFVLDEPSVGLHCRDIDRLVAILRRLTEQGNTVVVVEHDEAIIAAADEIVEIGPLPGREGGNVVFQGDRQALLRSAESLTGRYLSNRLTIDPPETRRPVRKRSGNWLRFSGVSKHNIRDIDVSIPLRRFVCLSGVSGSGKSTLLNHVLYDGLLRHRNQLSDNPAEIGSIEVGEPIDEVVLVDQSPLSRTPRSNPALYCDAWDEIRKLFASSEAAEGAGLTASSFSFNAGDGRCDHCQGLGYEKVEMQFLSDVFVTCPVCEGQRFKPEVLAITWKDHSISSVLGMTVDDACAFFSEQPSIQNRLEALRAVGLGYLTLGQPLNTLSGGESQRLKLVRYLPHLGRPRKTSRASRTDSKHALLLLDEPTTGLHRHDIKRLLSALQALVDEGHSLVVIEHQVDVLKSADWVIEMGPEAGADGGRIVAEGPPEKIAASQTATAPFLRAAEVKGSTRDDSHLLAAAEPAAPYIARNLKPETRNSSLEVTGAREHNLKDISVSIPHQQITVITGVSGSGKSTLAFDIIFAEGQRRFMESMSAYARQFVEQLPRPDIDRLTGIPPTVAIEQRLTTGSRKSTVATVTEVAQYLRLLFARIGIQHSPVTGEAVASLSPAALAKRLDDVVREPKVAKLPHLYLCSQLIRGRKGHHQPIANWIASHGYALMRVDGRLMEVSAFKKLDRYREHDIEVVVADLGSEGDTGAGAVRQEKLHAAITLGKGSCFLLHPKGNILSWFSTTRTDPVTGEAYPELDPKDFSFNSARGWCPTCRGYGRLYPWLFDEEEESPMPAAELDWSGEAPVCETCHGDRLNPVSRSVRLYFSDGSTRSLPDLLGMAASDLVNALRKLKLDARGRAIVSDILPQIEERLKFLDEVGLSYLTLDRSAQTLSGGEAQRIRLAAQLGSNLSGVLYVLDEPSIGLHARDNHRLIQALQELRAKGNTLVVVEHDEDTMRHADRIIDLGPGAGRHGGEVLAEGTLEEIAARPGSLTGRYLREGMAHPLRGNYRKLSPCPGPRQRKIDEDWLVLRKPTLRNLKGDDVTIPVGRLTMVCGVSGAGKSTLVRDLLLPAVAAASKANAPLFKGSDWSSGNGVQAAPFHTLLNGHLFKKVIEVDQTPIGKTPRSTPATYIGIFDIIRKVFASLPEAKMRGYNPGRFSFNTAGGRCEACQGAGRIKFEMSFMPDTFLPCDDCGGSRYGAELQEVRWKDKSIGDVLNMTFEEACGFFDFHSQLCQACQLMVDTGLGYLTLGQSSPTLSGGEAQRLKLVTELMRGLPTFTEKNRGLQTRHLFILEEPTIGLHFTDCERLIHVLHRLVDAGHTVVVIEHNLDLIAEADYVIEVGPEGGDAGGQILYQGAVDGLRRQKKSPTGAYLAPVRKKKGAQPPEPKFAEVR
jgi:excinuclease ABC subunit A